MIIRIAAECALVVALATACTEPDPSSNAPGLGEACQPALGCADGLGCIEYVCQRLALRGEVWWPQSDPPPDPLKVYASRAGTSATIDGQINASAIVVGQDFAAPVTYPRPFELAGLPADDYVVTGYVVVGDRAGIGQEQVTLRSDGGMVVDGEPVDSFRVYMLNEVILSSP